MAAAWRRREREGSQVSESNKSDRSQWSELAMDLAFLFFFFLFFFFLQCTKNSQGVKEVVGHLLECSP